MSISAQERGLRQRAVESVFGSLRLAGMEPSEMLAALLGRWMDGKLPLDQVHDALNDKLKEKDA